MANENLPNLPDNEGERQSETKHEPEIEQNIGLLIRDLSGQVAALTNKIQADRETANTDQKKYQKSYLRWTRASAISAMVFSFLSLILSVATLLVLHSSLDIMDKQREITDKQLTQMRNANALSSMAAEATHSAATIADATLKSSQKSFEIDQRPYLVADIPQFVNKPTAEKIVEANITAKNVGRTPAIKNRTFVRLLHNRSATSRDEYFSFIQGIFADLRKQANASAGKYAPYARKDTAPNLTYFATATDKIPLSAKEISEMENGAITFHYIGIIKYSDVFNSPFDTEFCYFYFGSDYKTWHICDSHNVIK